MRSLLGAQDNAGGIVSCRDDKLTGPQCAALLGIDPSTWRRYTNPNSDRDGRTFGPPPDGVSEPCGCKWWYRGTVLDWNAGRAHAQGQG